MFFSKVWMQLKELFSFPQVVLNQELSICLAGHIFYLGEILLLSKKCMFLENCIHMDHSRILHPSFAASIGFCPLSSFNLFIVDLPMNTLFANWKYLGNSPKNLWLLSLSHE